MATWIIAELTVREAQRRKILWVALLMGLVFLLIFGIGFHYIVREIEASGVGGNDDVSMIYGILLTAGLYAANILVTLMAVLISVATISGEIDSHTIDTIVTKPLDRRQVIMGKWLALAAMITVYVFLMAGGLMLIAYLRAGYVFDNILPGIALMILQALVVLSVTIAGGTRLSTLANGVLAFSLFGIAFLGGWVEQIGALFQNEAAVNIGIVTSLIMPADILWKKALSLFQPSFQSSAAFAGPFAVTSQPSDLMVAYGAIYMVAMVAIAIWSFSRRDL